MNEKKLLIVGIDPGITTAYAIIGIDSNLMHLHSSKQLDLNSIISETIKFGKIVLVGTDKSKTPNLVEAFATKVGAKIVNPPEDLKVDEKRNMTKNFDFDDEHQCDALASALFAFKSYKPLLDKIDFFAKENKKQEIKDRIKEIVITKKISIRNAVSLIEKKDEEDKIVEKAVIEKKFTENDFLKIYNKLKAYESEIKLLKRYNSNLNKKINDFQKAIVKKTEIKIVDKPDFKEKRIRFLENIVNSREKDIEFLKSLIKKFNEVVSNINNYYVLKKLDTLGIKEFNFKNKILEIKRNDMLLVGDANIFSNEVIDLLTDKVFVIVCKNPISRKTENNLPFVFLNAKDLKIIEDKYFGFIEKKHLEAEKNKLDWVKKVINDYKIEKNLISR